VSGARRENREVGNEMMNMKDVRDWLNTLPEDAVIGIDEGGLSLQMLGGEEYLELGGLPEDENEEE
jgi:hypothetical protein